MEVMVEMVAMEMVRVLVLYPVVVVVVPLEHQEVQLAVMALTDK